MTYQAGSATASLRGRGLPWLALVFVTVLLGGCAGRSADQPPEQFSSNKKDYAELIDKTEKKYGAAAADRIRAWLRLIDKSSAVSEPEQLQLVNDFFNAARTASDQQEWQRDDHWATPIEFLIRQAGDSEDFAIAKYFTLNMMGMPIDRLRITGVASADGDETQMVLAYYASADDMPLILDNANRQILPASARTDLKPLYSFNGKTLWLARVRKEDSGATEPEQAAPWRELIRRMQREMPPPRRGIRRFW